MADPIETKIVISAKVDQATRAVKDFGKAKDEALKPTAGSLKPFSDVGAGAKEAASQTDQLASKVTAVGAAATKTSATQKTAAQASQKASRDQQTAADATAKSLKQAQNQARLLGPQITDIVTGLATGQSPLTVLLQQGGQLKDVFGGVGNAAKALASVFTPIRLAIGGVVGVLGGLALAAYEGQKQSEELRKSLALTGNFAGTSAGQLDQMAKAISASQKSAISDVRETLQALVSSGQFAQQSLGPAAQAVTALRKITGQSAEEVVRDFADMSGGVADWAAKHNKAYNFLTTNTYLYIRSLEAQGRTQDAMRVTLEALAHTMESRNVPALGTLQRLWNSLSQTLKDVKDRLLDIGKDETAEKKIARLEERVAAARKLASAPAGFGVNDQLRKIGATQLEQFERELAAAQSDLRQVNRLTEAKSEQEQKVQQDILQSSKAYQDQLAAVDQAGSQKLLAQRQAALDAQQSKLELSHSEGLLSETQYNVGLNKIEQARLKAQESAVQRQIEIERSRVEERPEDKIAKNANLTALEAQLIEVRSRIAQAASAGRGIIAADALDEARQKAQEWAQIWQRAYEQVRQLAQTNAGNKAALTPDIDLRATADAVNKTAELKRQVADLQRDLNLRISLSIDPGQKAELQKQVADLARESTQAIDEASRQARLQSFNDQFQELQQRLQIEEAAIAQQVDLGNKTAAEGEQATLDLRKQQVPVLDQILARMEALATTPAEKNQVAQMRLQVQGQKDYRLELEKTAKSEAISSIADGLDEITTGSASAKQGLLDMVSSFAKAMLHVLEQKLAEQLVNQFINAANASSSGGSFFGTLLGIGVSAATGSSSTGTGTGTVISGDGMSYHASVGSSRQSAAGLRLTPRYRDGSSDGLIAADGGTRQQLAGDDAASTPVSRSHSAVGDVSIGITINGAQGSDADQRSAAVDLQKTVQASIDQWAAKQQRQGGILASRGRA